MDAVLRQDKFNSNLFIFTEGRLAVSTASFFLFLPGSKTIPGKLGVAALFIIYFRFKTHNFHFFSLYNFYMIAVACRTGRCETVDGEKFMAIDALGFAFNYFNY